MRAALHACMQHLWLGNNYNSILFVTVYVKAKLRVVCTCVDTR